MPLGEIRKVATRQASPTQFGAEAALGELASGSRALVALTPSAAACEAPQAYRQATFLAQLLAIKDQHPQTRERRRAEPDEAIAAYRAAVELTRFG